MLTPWQPHNDADPNHPITVQDRTLQQTLRDAKHLVGGTMVSPTTPLTFRMFRSTFRPILARPRELITTAVFSLRLKPGRFLGTSIQAACSWGGG